MLAECAEVCKNGLQVMGPHLSAPGGEIGTMRQCCRCRLVHGKRFPIAIVLDFGLTPTTKTACTPTKASVTPGPPGYLFRLASPSLRCLVLVDFLKFVKVSVKIPLVSVNSLLKLLKNSQRGAQRGEQSRLAR